MDSPVSELIARRSGKLSPVIVSETGISLNSESYSTSVGRRFRVHPSFSGLKVQALVKIEYRWPGCFRLDQFLTLHFGYSLHSVVRGDKISHELVAIVDRPKIHRLI